MGELIKALCASKTTILGFYTTLGKTTPYGEAFTIAEELLKLFEVIKEGLTLLESESFGSICYVGPILELIKQNIETLNADKYSHVQTAFYGELKRLWDKHLSLWSSEIFIATRPHPGIYHEIIMGDHLANTDTIIRMHAGVSARPSQSNVSSSFSLLFDRTTNNLTLDHLDIYLQRCRIDMRDIAAFWQNYAGSPSLRALANKILSTLHSSATCERLFSKSNRFLGLYRLAINPDRVEDQVIIAGNPTLYGE